CNDSIVRQDNKSAEKAHPTYHGPSSAAKFPKRTYCIRLCITTNSELCKHYRNSQDYNYSKINRNKSRSAKFPRDIRESPDITKTYRRTCSSHNKPKPAAPMFPVLRHLILSSR